MNAIRIVRTAPPTCGDINVTIAVPAQGDQPATTHTRPARHTGELSAAEKDELKYAQHDWHVKDKWIKDIDHSLATIHAAIVASAKRSLTPLLLGNSCHDIMIWLHQQYNLSDAEVRQMLRERYRKLSNAPAKKNILPWTQEWEALTQEMVDENMYMIGEENICRQFLDSGSKWAPDFCKTWPVVIRNFGGVFNVHTAIPSGTKCGPAD